METPVFKTKPVGYVGQFPAGREWWAEVQAKAELREKRINEALQKIKSKQKKLPGIK